MGLEKKYCQNCLEIFPNRFLKILYDVCSLNGNIKCSIIQFLEDDGIVFHLASMNQCEERGVRVIYRPQLMRIR
jgi:hypothetical protein